MTTAEYKIALFPISLDILTFNDDKHANNFIKYLFSKSNNHKKNEYTSLNYVLMDCDDIKCVFNSTEESYNKFYGFFKENYDYKNLLNTIIYVGFFIEYENKLYTNLLEPSEEDDELLHLTWSDAILNNYLENSGNTIEQLIEEINDIVEPFEPYKNGNIIVLKELMTNQQQDKLKLIQSVIFSEIRLMYQQIFKNNDLKDLLYISHIDQPNMFYHIHLLMATKQ